MKKLFLSLAAIIVATAMTAQNTLVATLSHGENVTMFYGSSALINAVDASVSGDVITLSGGKFGFAKITKGITIRGAGAEGDAPTTIYESNSDNYSINIPSDDANRFVLEGVNIYLGVSKNIQIFGGNLYFIKCTISPTLTFGSSSTAEAKFVNCDIVSIALNGASNAKFINCKVGRPSNSSGTTSKAEFFNCHLDVPNPCYYYRSSFVNCILYSTVIGSDYTPSIPSDASAMNCIYIGCGGGTQVDCYKANASEVYADYNTGTDRWGTTFYTRNGYELSDEAKATYLGTDGKEVGLYGGQYPYDLTPNYPLITKLNVAKQSTADNKLSVEIEVSAAE